MADEFQDDEYHFSDSPELEDIDEEAMKPEVSTGGITQLKRVLIGLVGLFIIVLLGYKVIGGMSGGSKVVSKSDKRPQQVAANERAKPMKRTKVAKANPAPQPAPAPQIAPAAMPTPDPLPTYTQATQSPQVSNPSPQMMSQLRRLNRANRKTEQEVGQLNNRIGEVSGNVVQTSQKLDSLARNLQLLTEKILVQQEEIKSLKQEKKKAELKKKKQMEKADAHYYIQAVIPGRAWLQSKRGDIKTVAEGVQLDGYGKIVEIFPKKGEITTSSGKTITFSPDDI